MSDLAAAFLAIGFVVGCIVVARAVGDVARWRASASEAHAKEIRRAIRAATAEIAAAMRHRTKAGLGLVRAKVPPPPPPDPRIEKGIEAIERLGLSPEEADDLAGQYEAVAGLRPATRSQIEEYVARMNALRIPLPG